MTVLLTILKKASLHVTANNTFKVGEYKTYWMNSTKFLFSEIAGIIKLSTRNKSM